MLKKITIAAIAAMLLTLTACGNSANEDTESSSKAAATTTTEAAATIESTTESETEETTTMTTTTATETTEEVITTETTESNDNNTESESNSAKQNVSLTDIDAAIATISDRNTESFKNTYSDLLGLTNDFEETDIGNGYILYICKDDIYFNDDIYDSFAIYEVNGFVTGIAVQKECADADEMYGKKSKVEKSMQNVGSFANCTVDPYTVQQTNSVVVSFELN